MAVFAAYAEAFPDGEDWVEERSRSAFAVRDGITHALARQSERRNEQAPAIAITSRWLRSKSEIRGTAVEFSFGRCEGRNLRRFSNGIPKSIPKKILTENKR